MPIRRVQLSMLVIALSVCAACSHDDDDDSLWSVSLKNGARTLLSVEPVVAGNDLHQTFEIVLDETKPERECFLGGS